MKEQTINTISLCGDDWHLSGWMRHQWKFQKLMETDSFSLPVVMPIPATVPGAVQADLLRAGLIEDWNVDDHFLHMEWVEHREWVYEKHFTLTDIDAQRYELLFEGLDYSGYVFVNGMEVLYFEGMHLPHHADVTNAVRVGDNHLRIVFLQPPEVEGQVGYTSRVKTLKSRYNYGWDWMPRMVNIGIFGDVSLKIERGGVLGDVYPRASLEDDCGVVRTDIEVNRIDDRELILTVSLLDAAGSLIDSKSQPVTAEEMRLTLRCPNAALWQVSGFGAQNLYRVVTQLSDKSAILDEKSQTIGFRTLKYDRPEGAAEDTFPYVPVVNGVRIPVRGVNWVPLSPFYGTVTEQNYRAQLTAIKNMNVTMIRVWGGALLESDTFYDLCDELGILVWQEFPQSSSGIENAACSDADFIEDLLEVAKVDILRRRARACLAIWCGGNELYYDDYRPQGLEHPTLMALSHLVTELDGDRLFLPASPSGPVPGSMDYIGTGKLHDTHGPWNYAAGPRAYYQSCNRDDSLLHSEVGAPAASRMELLVKYRGNAKLWPPTKHNRYWLTRGAWWLHMEQMTDWFGEFDGEKMDVDTYVRAFRLTQAEALRYVSSAVRYAGDRKAGMIVWMGNEPFPNAANTSVLEFDGCPKPAYFELKRMFAHVMLGLRHDSVVARDGRVTVIPFLRADTTALPICADDVTLTVYGMNGNIRINYALPTATGGCDWQPTEIPVDATVLVRLGSAKLGICVEYVFLPDAVHPFAPLLALDKAEVDVICRDDCITLTNKGSVVALYCDVTAKDAEGRIVCTDDGNLCLLPGERRTIHAGGVACCHLTILND
ncbi:MAG: hypothetical protein IJW40_08160 [Clostridia bacterium]|nr:hypothetical protein [Clostridia bacterium]